MGSLKNQSAGLKVFLHMMAVEEDGDEEKRTLAWKFCPELLVKVGSLVWMLVFLLQTDWLQFQ